MRRLSCNCQQNVAYPTKVRDVSAERLFTLRGGSGRGLPIVVFFFSNQPVMSRGVQTGVARKTRVGSGRFMSSASRVEPGRPH